MHDLMHDLAILVAGAECAILSLNYEGSINKNTYHVSFECKTADKIPALPVQASKIRHLFYLTKVLVFPTSHFVMQLYQILSSYAYWICMVQGLNWYQILSVS